MKSKDKIKDEFSEFKKGQTFYIHNGAWDGIIVQDDKDGEFYATIGSGFGVRDLEGFKNIDELFTENDTITKGNLTETQYNDIMTEKGLAIRGFEGELVSCEGELYIVDEDYLVISVDEKYRGDVLISVRSDKGKFKKPYNTLKNKKTYEFAETVKRYLKEESKVFYAQSLIALNKELKNKVEKLELEDILTTGDFEEYIIDYIRKNKGKEYGFTEEGIYIRGDYDISGEQMKYLYVLDNGVVKLQKYHTTDESDKKEVSCKYSDIKEGVRLNIENRGKVSLFECLENLARTDYLFKEDKGYIKDSKFNQSRF